MDSHRQREIVPLYPNPPPPSQPRRQPESEDYDSDFPPIRKRDDTPPDWQALYPPSQPRPHATYRGGLGRQNIANSIQAPSASRRANKAKSSTSKRKARVDPSDDERGDHARPLKASRSSLVFVDDDNLRWLKGEIMGINGAIQDIREHEKRIGDKLDELKHLFDTCS
ncbi:hypothetical protein CPC08DRAFT_753895 [Agrocybe pediades]|nr:hypothetical protein CPC08DRAFT_753895 [Agrocybe pediades]